MSLRAAAPPSASPAPASAVAAMAKAIVGARSLMAAIPESAIAALGRFSLAAVFWKSGQTKIEGFSADLVAGSVEWGLPRLAPAAVDLFRDEYQLPLLPPEWAATLAALGEHALPLLLLLGLGTRFAALGLLIMTAVIQIGVYPSAYPTHGVWAAVLLWLMVRGPGAWSIDQLIARRWGRT